MFSLTASLVRNVFGLLLVSTFYGLLVYGADTANSAKKNTDQTAPNSKDSKLSSLLLALMRAVPQQDTAAATENSTRPGFSYERLPNSITDNIRVGHIRINQNGEVQVYIELSELSEKNVQVLRSFGIKVQLVGKPVPNKAKGEILAPVVTIQALLPAAMIRLTKNLSFVKYIRSPDYAISNTGSVDSQGDHILQADAVRSSFGLDGTGVRVGVISDGIGGIFATGCTSCGPASASPSPIALEDLPNAVGTRNSNGVLVAASGGISATSFNSDGNLEACLGRCDTTSNTGSEGTAMLEIVHDLAPAAQLYFANADSSLSFEQAVDFVAANTDVVVTDFSFFTPPFDGTSSVSMTASDALSNETNPIRAFFASAGNYAQNHYQGLYFDSGIDGASIVGQPGHLHLFKAVPPDPVLSLSATTDNANFGPLAFDPVVIIPPGEDLEIYLAWNDATGLSANDYDLFIVPLNCSGISNNFPVAPCVIAGPPVASSMNPQMGTQNPAETISWINNTKSPAELGIVIQNVQNLAAARTFDLFVHGYKDKESLSNHNFNTISGSIPALGDSTGVLTVGAIDESQCSSPDNCIGTVELFSSQGPTQITPQATARMKPDLVAVDKVCITGAGGFGNGPASHCPPSQPSSYTPQVFAGTSAAAPHAGAIAALALQAAPCLLSAAPNPQPPSTARLNLEGQFAANAVPLAGVPGTVPNSEEGNGLVDALALAMGMLPTVAAGSTQTVSATSMNGASVVLTGAGADPNKCPLTALKWTGNCGTGSATGLGLHANLTCPIGENSVQISVSNNNISFSQPGIVPFTVIVTDFTLSVSPQAATVSPGNPSIYSIAVTASPQGAFSNPVTLSCPSGLPTSAACSFSPSSVTPGNTSAVSMLTIFTSNPAMTGPVDPHTKPMFDASTLWFCLLASVAALMVWSKCYASALGLRCALWALLIIFAAWPIGCGSYNTTPASKTYTVMITGTSNQLQHSQTISLTVQ